MSKSRLYGQNVQIKISFDGTNYDSLGEVMDFSYKSTHIVKKHSSLGENGVGAIDVLDDGGTLSFTLDKTDAKFNSFFSNMERHLRGAGQAGKRGKAPYIQIVQLITHLDDSIESNIFDGVVLHDDESSINGRTEVVTEKMQGTYKTRRVSTVGVDANTTHTNGTTAFATAIANFNNLKADVTDTMKEAETVTAYNLIGLP